MRVQSFNKAIKDYDAAIALDAGNRTAYFNRGIGCGRKGDLDGAIKDFTEAIRLDPNDGTALKARAAAWQIKGEVAEFTEHENEKSRARHGGNPSKDSPPAPKRLDDYDNAIKDYSDAIRLDPKYVAGFLGRGVAWERKGEFNRAISDLTAAIQLDPKNTIGYTIRGYVYAWRHDNDNAIEDLSHAIQLDPRNAGACSAAASSGRAKANSTRRLPTKRRRLISSTTTSQPMPPAVSRMPKNAKTTVPSTIIPKPSASGPRIRTFVSTGRWRGRRMETSSRRSTT